MQFHTNHPRITQKIIFHFLCFLPALFVLFLIYSFGINVPYWDEWHLVSLFSKVAQGEVSIIDFFQLHNEHRIIFPRLLLTAIAFSTNWNLKICMLFSFFEACIIWILCRKMIYNHQPDNLYVNRFALIISTVLIFSLAQWENWLWGFQIAWFLINVLLLATLHSLNSPNISLRNPRFWIAILFCMISSFSAAHGLMTWLAALPMFLLIQGKNSNLRRIRLITTWTLFAAATFIAYTTGYVKPPHHPSTLQFLESPAQSLSFLLNYMGGALENQWPSPQFWGFLSLAGFLLSNFYLFFISDTRVKMSALPWLSMGWFSVGFGLITTVGRVGLGTQVALESRYTSVSILQIIALANILSILLKERIFYLPSSKSKYVAALALSLMVLLYSNQSVDALKEASKISLEREKGLNCLQFIEYISPTISDQREKNCLDYLHPTPHVIIESSKSLQSMGFRPSHKQHEFISDLSRNYGEIDTIRFSSKQGKDEPVYVEISGWARLPDERQQPNNIFLSVNEERAFTAVANLDEVRKDVAIFFKSNLYLHSGWSLSIEGSKVKKLDSIYVWLYSPRQGAFVRVASRIVNFENSPEETSALTP